MVPRAFLYDPRFHEHICDGFHPERPERLSALIDGLETAGVWKESARVAAREATREELSLVHTERYIDGVLDALGTGWGHLDADTFFSPGSKAAALLAAGGGVDLARAVHRRDANWGWALVRPPGHHASWSRPAGFCIFNNIAVAAASLIAGGDAKRVMIFDWDVHHGNGTQDQFIDRADVLFISVHQWPHYPGSGRSEDVGDRDAAGRTVNFPFPAGASDDDYLALIDRVVAPLARAFEPSHILVSAGFDAHDRDPLAGMSLTRSGYREMAARLKRLADDLCAGRLTLFLEGGYDLAALRESSAAVVEGIESGPKEAPRNAAASASHQRVIDRTIAEIRPHWPGVFS